MTNSTHKTTAAKKWDNAIEAIWRGYCDAAMGFPFDYEFCDASNAICASNYELGRLAAIQLEAWNSPMPNMGKKNLATLKNAIFQVKRQNAILGEASPFLASMFPRG